MNMNKCENVIKLYASLSSSLISLMEHSKDQWWIKDGESRYICANDTILHDASVPKNFDVEGRLDKEISAPCEELCEKFVAHDKKVIDENRRISAIVISYYGEGNFTTPVPNLQNKMPFL